MKTTKKKKASKAAESAVLVLRTSDKKGRGRGGFQWPTSGHVEAPDWVDDGECGHGLHGLLWGCGNGRYLSDDHDAIWQVVRVLAADVRDLGEKIKFPRGEVVFSGDRSGALAYLDAHGAADKPVVYAARTAGNCGTATAGYYGHATVGDYGIATAGNGGTATAGDWGHATAGACGHATAGDYGRATAGAYGHATAGDYGRATAGAYGRATAGDWGHATAGACGHATAGDWGAISIRWWDAHAARGRVATAYVGEGGIEANVAYKLDSNGKFVKASEVK